MRIRVIDFETTGEPPEADVIEAAYVDVVCQDVDIKGDQWLEVSIEAPGWSTLVRPTRPISVEARAVHHISDADVADSMHVHNALATLVSGESTRSEPNVIGVGFPPPDYFCAHNTAFERAFFDPPGAKWICTYKAALRLWPDAPSHSNSVLRYWLDDCDPGEAGMPPHRALPDCRVTALILLRCLDAATISQLVEWTEQPAYKPTIGFGKHRGKKWADAPRDYVEWVLRSDFDDDTKWNARQGLAR